MVRISKGECNFYGECPVPNLGCTSDCCINQIFEERNAAKDEVRDLQKVLRATTENSAVQQWADMYNRKDKKHFDCQLSLAKAEDKLKRIEETCDAILKVTIEDKVLGAKHQADYVLAKSILEIIKE